jgi:hypothetical protein
VQTELQNTGITDNTTGEEIFSANTGLRLQESQQKSGTKLLPGTTTSSLFAKQNALSTSA